MKSIIHCSSWEELQQMPKNCIAMAHLVTYDVQTMNGEYQPRVVIYKNRSGNHGIHITQEQCRILQDCVLNDKPQPAFCDVIIKPLCSLTNREILDEVSRRNGINRRLYKLESDLFPPEQYDVSHYISYKGRLSRIEKKLGIDQGPGDDLGRIEQCEFYLKNTYWRLNKLDREIYPTQKDIDEMPRVITIDGWCQKFENRLGVDLAFIDLAHRLKHIEDAWECTKNAPPPPIRELDAKITQCADIGRRLTKLEADLFIACFFGSVSDLQRLPVEDRLSRIEVRLGAQKQGDISCRLQHCETIFAYMEKAKPKAKETPYVCPVLKDQKALQDALQDMFGKEETYAPNYQVGDIFWCRGREWKVRGITLNNHYWLEPVVDCSILNWLVPVEEIDGFLETSTSPIMKEKKLPLPEFDC